MKVEIPQILWHNTSTDNKNAPLLSLSILESSEDGNTFILATSGSTPDVHIWKLSFNENHDNNTARDILIKGNGSSSNKSNNHDQSSTSKSKSTTKIEHLLTLERYDRAVNTISFSPNGNYLGSAGDSGSIILWSSKYPKQNTLYESILSNKESSLACQIPISQISGDIMDFSWCPSSRRFVVGSMDHTFSVFELIESGGNTKWENVYRSRDHVSYVQGVSWDPLGVYLASMGSDKTVRVYSRKQLKKKNNVISQSSDVANNTTTTSGSKSETEQTKAVNTTNNSSFLESKFEMGKSRIIKYYTTPATETKNKEKRLLFADESTVESFFRRLNWSIDGSFLITPAAMWKNDTDSSNKNNNPSSFATLLFARHKYDQPYAILSGFDQPCIVVKPCPVLFTLPENKENKENRAKLPKYRSLFAVLTTDSVFIYDTYHWGKPLSVSKGLHYSSLTDCDWSKDGRRLLVTSSDGYISILSFDNGELGTKIEGIFNSKTTVSTKNSAKASITPAQQHTTTLLPPCAPGQAAILEAPPMKKMKVLSSDEDVIELKKDNEDAIVTKQNDAAVIVNNGITDLSLEGKVKKKKKRVQPILISSA